MDTTTVILVVLIVLVVVLIVDRVRGQQKLREQINDLSRVVGDEVRGGIGVFGDVREKLGELTKRTKDIEEVGKNISSLQELLRAPKFRGGFGELMLERLLADILPHDNYALQYRFRSGEAVDAIIRIGGHLVLSRFERLHPRVEAALQAVPAAVLSTIVAPAAVSRGPVELVTMVLAVILCLRFNPMVVLVASLGVLVALRHATGAF